MDTKSRSYPVFALVLTLLCASMVVVAVWTFASSINPPLMPNPSFDPVLNLKRSVPNLGQLQRNLIINSQSDHVRPVPSAESTTRFSVHGFKNHSLQVIILSSSFSLIYIYTSMITHRHIYIYVCMYSYFFLFFFFLAIIFKFSS